jgi:polyisoprenoid-binding protein YceI
MKNIKYIVLSLIVLAIIIVASGFVKKSEDLNKDVFQTSENNKSKQTINMFVTHGHCSTPFSGVVGDLKIAILYRPDLGNPLENMKISFDIDPNTFVVCSGDEDLTKRIKTPGLFIGKLNEKITFRSTSIYTMGIDWYQINGKMSIKGVESDVKLFATGIRNLNETTTTSLVLEGQMNLFDWGIDYDMIVNGKSEKITTKWMHLNLKINELNRFSNSF